MKIEIILRGMPHLSFAIIHNEDEGFPMPRYRLLQGGDIERTLADKW